MNISNCSIKSANSINKNCSNDVLAKLRRLKIQEDLLLQNVNKNSINCNDDQNFYKTSVEFKSFLANLKKSYYAIKTLLDDVKSATKSEDSLKSLDINDVKKDVLELDDKIKSLKLIVQKQQLSLKDEEQKLIIEIRDITLQSSKIKTQKRIISKSYSEIVPSPVKTLIHSPLKCPEVQQFQDFLCNTNKHGGWDEYNHNIFVKLWQKYFEDKQDFTNFKSEENSLFIGEVLLKVSGIKKPDVISHMKWYSRYLYLQQKQQQALKEWKIKNRALKAPHRLHLKSNDIKTTKNISVSSRRSRESSANSFKNCETDSKMERNLCNSYNRKKDDEEFHESIAASEYLKEKEVLNKNIVYLKDQVNVSRRYLKPTKQWVNKCITLNEKGVQINAIENIGKRAIPHWRLDLQ